MNIVKYYYNLKELFSILFILFENVVSSSDGKAEFSATINYSSIQCHIIHISAVSAA